MEGEPHRDSLHDFQTSPSPLGLSARHTSISTTHSISTVPQGLQGKQGLQCFQSSRRSCAFCLPHSSPQHTEVSFLSYCPVSCYKLIADKCLLHEVTVQMSTVAPKSTAPACLKFQVCSKPEPKAKRTSVQGSRRTGTNVCLSTSPLSPPCPPI